jgi:hypothetical protein
MSRASTKELRTYRGDFLNYSESAEKGIITCQARLKRQSVEKGAKGVDFVGDVNSPAVQQRPAPTPVPTTGTPINQDVGWNN